MCSDPVDPAGEVLSSSVGSTIGMWALVPSVFIVAAGRYIGILELKKGVVKRGCWRCGGFLVMF